MHVISTTLLVISFAVATRAHSWVECTQYKKEITGQDFDSSQCSGYVRDWASYGAGNSPFGQDHGIDSQNGAPNFCSKSLSTGPTYSGSYSAAYPMASYTAGETVRIVWPAKNHANYECMNNIPDTEMKLYANKVVNPTNDPQSIGTNQGEWQLVKDWHAGTAGGGTDGVPFQNCPKYCENTDKAVCYGDWTIPAKEFPTSGVYSFMWYWVFNPGQAYTACFEASVDVSTTVDDTDFDDSTGSGTGTVKEWNIDFPICVSGGTYDATALGPLGTTLSGIIGATVTVTYEGSLSNSFEVKGSYTASTATGVADNTDAIKAAAENVFGGTVTLCADIHVTAVYEGGSGSGDDALRTCHVVALATSSAAVLGAW